MTGMGGWMGGWGGGLTYLAVDATDLDAGIEAGTVVGLSNVPSEGILEAWMGWICG